MIFFRSLGAVAFGVLALTCTAQAQAQTRDLHALHDALHLSASQEAAWRTFNAATAADPEQEARDRNAAMMMPKLTAPRRADLSIAEMEADLDTLKRRSAALKAFYAILTPQQQTIFDSQTAPQAQQQSR
jgi:hypothetical protein